MRQLAHKTGDLYDVIQGLLPDNSLPHQQICVVRNKVTVINATLNLGGPHSYYQPNCLVCCRTGLIDKLNQVFQHVQHIHFSILTLYELNLSLTHKKNVFPHANTSIPNWYLFSVGNCFLWD